MFTLSPKTYIMSDKSKYPDSHTSGDKKGSVSDAGYNERNEVHPDHTEKIPAPHANQDHPGTSENSGSQDDTGGGNRVGQRSDDL
jgi:hypothetical protein